MSSSTIRGKANGFTLVEILISLVILSMLVTLAGTAYSVYIDRWQDNLGDFEQQLSETRATMLVDQALQNVFPFVVETPAEQEEDDFGFFFFGESDRLEGIIGSGVFNYANAGIFKLELKENTLTYYERSTADVLLLRADQDFTYTRKLMYNRDVTEVSFRYYGWPNYSAKLEYLSGNSETDTRQWYSSYNGVYRRLLPETIEMTITTADNQWVLTYPVAEGSDNIIRKYFDD